MRKDQGAVGGAAAGAGDPQHPRGDVGIIACSCSSSVGRVRSRSRSNGLAGSRARLRITRLRTTNTEGSRTTWKPHCKRSSGRQGQERGAPASRGGASARRRLRAAPKRRATIAVDGRAEGAVAHPAHRVGREHADRAAHRRRERAARAREGIPARPDYARAAPRGFLPRGDGQGAHGHRPDHLKGEAKGVKLQGGVVDFVTRQIEVECLPGDIPEHITVDVSELMMNDGIRVRDLATGGKWTPISDPDTMIVHVVPPRPRKRRRWRPRGCGTGDAGRARSHQEGQDGQGRGEGEEGPRSCRRARQSRAAVPRHAPQRRLPGRGRVAATAGASRDGAGRARGAGRALAAAADVLLVKPLTFMNLSGEAVGALRAVLQDGGRPICWWWPTTWRCPSGVCGRGAGSAGGHNGFKSIAQHLGHRRWARLRVGVGRGDTRRDLADHVLARFDRGRAAGHRGGHTGRPMPSRHSSRRASGAVMNRFNATAAEERSEDNEAARRTVKLDVRARAPRRNILILAPGAGREPSPRRIRGRSGPLPDATSRHQRPEGAS